MTVLFGPADAVAASRCLIARSIAGGKTDHHPRRCGWCPEPMADLQALIAGFNDWAAYRPTGKTGGTSERHEIRVWMELDRAEQRRLVIAAQALEADQPPEPPPAVVAPEPPIEPPPLAAVTNAPASLSPVTKSQPLEPPPAKKDVAWLG